MTIDLDELERLAKAATAGPYYAVSPQVAYDNCTKHEFCPEHGDAHEDAWTVSPSPEHAGWNTDTGMSGYGICEHDARFFSALDPASVLELVRLARIGRDHETRLAQEAMMQQNWTGTHDPELFRNVAPGAKEKPPAPEGTGG